MVPGDRVSSRDLSIPRTRPRRLSRRPVTRSVVDGPLHHARDSSSRSTSCAPSPTSRATCRVPPRPRHRAQQPLQARCAASASCPSRRGDEKTMRLESDAERGTTRDPDARPRRRCRGDGSEHRADGRRSLPPGHADSGLISRRTRLRRSPGASLPPGRARA